MRLIDADALPVRKEYCVDEAGFGATFYVVDKRDIDKAPTIDAIPVVRCKDCKHYVDRKEISKACCYVHLLTPHPMPSDGYCSYGERKDGDGNG